MAQSKLIPITPGSFLPDRGESRPFPPDGVPYCPEHQGQWVREPEAHHAEAGENQEDRRRPASPPPRMRSKSSVQSVNVMSLQYCLISVE